MVRAAMRPFSSQTRSTAPGTLPHPQEMPAPSKAGPAAVEVTSSSPPFQRAISPFVPMSQSTATRSDSARPLANTAQVMSAPTKAFMQGGSTALRPCASTVCPKRQSAAKGAAESETGSRPLQR